jgi:hypothetical protein
VEQDGWYTAQFLPLFADLEHDENTFPEVTPFLAHYTSIDTCEKILIKKEVWFSNPLFMNDVQEVRFGVIEGTERAILNASVREACETAERSEKLNQAIMAYRQEFDQKHALDTYLFCLSEHDPNDDDGLLSMWRGYGANGDGVALIIDTSKIEAREDTPFVIAPVQYASDEQRLAWLDGLFAILANCLKSKHIPDDSLHIAAWWLMERIKLFALFSKHRGFSEEREWRIAYLPWRDPQNLLRPFMSYLVTANGVQPKLKLPFREIPGLVSDQFTIENLVHRILLGPGSSTALAKATFERMLELVRPGLKDRLQASGIPYRKT